MANRNKQPNPAKHKLLTRLGELISDGLFTLVKWNFLFLLTCLPIFTFGPALAALYCCTNALAKDDRPQIKSGKLFFSAFRTSFRRALPLGILTIAVSSVFGGGFLLYSSMISENILYIPMTSVSLLILILFWGVLIHLLPLLFQFEQIDWEHQTVVLSDAPLSQLWREATHFALAHMKGTLLALSFSIIYLGGQLMMFPMILPFTLAIGFSFPAMAASLAHTEPEI